MTTTIGNMMDERSRILLKTLIERYIADGQPVGSKMLSQASGLDLSAATVRNVMAYLEEAGYIVSPHTSAGRIPTTQGYRLFVDSLLTVQPIAQQEISAIEDELNSTPPKALSASASQLLSKLTHFAGVVVSSRLVMPKIRQVEFLGLSEKRILLIIVTSDGNVQNRILLTEHAYTASELAMATNYFNEHFAGYDFDEIRARFREEIRQLKDDLQKLTAVALAPNDRLSNEIDSPIVVSGEKNLLDIEGFSSNMKQLRDLFDLFEQRTGLMQLFEHCYHAQGVQIFIGGESGLGPLSECSVVTAPYEVDGVIVGTVGVIGPTRMLYERVIPIVDITARLLSSTLSHAHYG